MAKEIDKEKVENSEVLESAEEVKEEGLIEDESPKEEPEMKITDENVSDETAEEETEEDEIEKLKADVQEAKDKYLRLYSEFENFRRRTAKERLDLIRTATEDLMSALLPVMDDFERAQKALEESEDHKATQEGFELIFNKFSNILKQKGLKQMEDKTGSEFSTEFHEAISQMPVGKKKMKGKIIDVVEKGYYLDEKVIRFAKVVIGA
ncbi:MAG: nucleotide exchange factor GrpE [Cyclobacteriaceae bacterium]|nr:nucleotide exchange factor GrpE [Cyclobacteriaceae bacterium]MCK5704560.1 nucleotide exchange factor GrpE [Cyclobacteriaceae bacterium]